MEINNDFDSFPVRNNAPIIKIVISEIEIQLRIFFNISCCEIMFEQHEQGVDYRSAFAKAVFHMYRKTTENTKCILAEDDFVNSTDKELQSVLDEILKQDSKVEAEYNNTQGENIYERFYKANEAVLEGMTAGISKSLVEVSKTIRSLNKPLLASLSNALSNITIPPNHLAQITSIIKNVPTYDFAKLSSVYLDIPHFEIMQPPSFAQFQSVLENIPQIQFSELASILSNIPRPIFDVHDIISPLNRMVENIESINAGLAQALQTPLIQMTEATQSLFSSIDFSLLIYRKEWNEGRETLLKYEWFYSNELPEEIVNTIHDNQETLSVYDVDGIIVGYFRKNRCEALKNIVKSWNSLPYFKCRTRIFHEALVNHSRRYFNSAVTLLTVHTEGVITDFVRTNLKNPRFHVEKAIEDIKTELEKNTDVSIYEYEIFSDVIRRIEEAFNENFKHSDPDATSNKSRHKIAHGHAYEAETEVNSLKRFLYLNEIYHLFMLLSNSE